MIRWAMSGTAKRLVDVPKGAVVTEVNGRGVVDHCEGCGRRIYDDQEYVSYEDGPVLHLKCDEEGLVE